MELGEPIRYKEGIYTIVINEDDVFDLSIEEGDLVDIAFPDESPEKAKVIWKHEAGIIEDESVTISKKNNKSLKKESILQEQTLVGKTIFVIGNEGMKSAYRNSVEDRGGTFLWADSTFKQERLEPLVRKADVCVFLLSVSGHTVMNQVKQLCKDYEVPFETTWSNGKSSIIRISEGI